VLGVIGLKKVNDGQASNRGMALAGIICGGVGVIIAIANMALGAAMGFGNLNF